MSRKESQTKCEQLLYTTSSKAVAHYFEYIQGILCMNFTLQNYQTTKQLKFNEASFLSKQIALFRVFI